MGVRALPGPQMMKEEREARIGREQDFYNRVAKILQIEYNYIVPFFKKTRWNARCLGNGRFPGYGLIRMYGPKLIHVVLNHPVHTNKHFTDIDECIKFLSDIMSTCPDVVDSENSLT